MSDLLARLATARDFCAEASTTPSLRATYQTRDLAADADLYRDAIAELERLQLMELPVATNEPQTPAVTPRDLLMRLHRMSEFYQDSTLRRLATLLGGEITRLQLIELRDKTNEPMGHWAWRLLERWDDDEAREWRRQWSGLHSA